MKIRLKNRLILSIFMLCVTLITLTTSTFAWFATNRNASFDEIELEIGNTDSLLISVDGLSYRTSIPSDMIKRAIVAKKNSLSYNDQALNNNSFINNEWNKISLEPITTSDLNTFNCIDKEHIANDVDNEGNILESKYYELHEVDETETYSYLSFDLWFRVDSSKTVSKTYDLKFVNDEYVRKENEAGNPIKASYIEGEDSYVNLYNYLNTSIRSYSPNDEIVVNCKDAMRLGITRLEQNGEEDIKKYIFEPYEGLGSYALKRYIDTTDANYYKYDPNKNAMLTYFNNLNEARLDPLDDEFDYVNNVYKDNLKDDVSLGEINPNSSNTAYTTLKFNIKVWLEGYDADYIVGMKNNKLKMFLNFYVEER